MVLVGQRPNSKSIRLSINGSRSIIDIHPAETHIPFISKVGDSNWYRLYDTYAAITLLSW